MRRRATFLTFALVLVTSSASAQEEETPVSPSRPASLRVNMQSDVPIREDFIMGPTRFVLPVAPGDQRTVQVEITNRMGRDATFLLSAEDFATEEGGTPTFFDRMLDGPYPARLWISPEADRFTLKHGERAFLRVTVNVPEDAEAGDHQAALIAETLDPPADASGIQVTSRVASLFIVSVEGDVVREGELTGLTTTRNINWFTPIHVQLRAKNTGTVHMAPVGTIDIRNLFGIVVDQIPLRDWIILRDSQRMRELEWKPKFALGRYTATTNIAAFEGEELAALSVAFWVVPLVPVLLLLLAIFFVSFIVQFFFSRFEIKKKE